MAPIFSNRPAVSDTLTLLLAQFKNPIVLTLLAAAGLSLFLRDSTDAVIILVIVLVSGLLGFWQERGAADAVEKLLAIVKIKTTVLRDGGAKIFPLRKLFPEISSVSMPGMLFPQMPWCWIQKISLWMRQP